MEYGVQVTLTHVSVKKEQDGKAREYRNDTTTVLPCINLEDAETLATMFDGLEFSCYSRRVSVVVKVWNADYRKYTWFSVNDLLQAADEINTDEKTNTKPKMV